MQLFMRTDSSRNWLHNVARVIRSQAVHSIAQRLFVDVAPGIELQVAVTVTVTLHAAKPPSQPLHIVKAASGDTQKIRTNGIPQIKT